MYGKLGIFILVLICIEEGVLSQRSPYAGSRPTGYKDSLNRKPDQTADVNSNDVLNRFGENNINNSILTGTQRPPLQGVEIVYAMEDTVQQNRPVSPSQPLTPTNSASVTPAFPNIIPSSFDNRQGIQQTQAQIPTSNTQFTQQPNNFPITTGMRNPTNMIPGGQQPQQQPIQSFESQQQPGQNFQPQQQQPGQNFQPQQQQTTDGLQPSRLPYDAYGDTQLVDLLNQRPVDQRPFWLINYEAIEAHRNSTPTNFGSFAQRGSFAG